MKNGNFGAKVTGSLVLYTSNSAELVIISVMQTNYHMPTEKP